MQGFLHSLLVLLFPDMDYTFLYVRTIVSEVPTAYVSTSKFFGTIENHLEFINRTVTIPLKKPSLLQKRFSNVFE